MTFYSILFGLVFVMSFFTTISVLGGVGDRLPLLSESVLILAMSFNDIINTSEAVENEKSDYSLLLKALDALSFFLYMIAIFAVQPKNSVSNIDVTAIFPVHNEMIFWIVVTVIFLIGFLWNTINDKELVIRYNRFILFLAAFSFIMVLLSMWLEKALVIMTPIFFTIYFIFLLVKILRPSFQSSGN